VFPRSLAINAAETRKESMMSFWNIYSRIKQCRDDLLKSQHDAEKSAFGQNI